MLSFNERRNTPGTENARDIPPGIRVSSTDIEAKRRKNGLIQSVVSHTVQARYNSCLVGGALFVAGTAGAMFAVLEAQNYSLEIV